jgi:hypothetical protein
LCVEYDWEKAEEFVNGTSGCGEGGVKRGKGGDDEWVYIRALSRGQIDEKQWTCR